MKVFSFLFFLLPVYLTSCSSSSEQKFDDKTYEQHKESLEEKEKKDPLHFLHVAGDDKKNLIGQTVVRGTIINNATVCTYKDVRVKMLCYKDGKMMEEHEDIIDKEIKPNSKEDFKTKYRLPKGTDSIALSIMSASVVSK